MNGTLAPSRDLESQLRALLGTWFLREAYLIGPTGKRMDDAYGVRPSGVIHYGPDMRMMALITHGGRRLLDGDRQAAPEHQRAEAYKSCVSYAGRFTLEGDWVLHHIDVSTYPNWVGTVLRRQLAFEGDAAALLTAAQMQNGIESVLKLVWQRQPGA